MKQCDPNNSKIMIRLNLLMVCKMKSTAVPGGEPSSRASMGAEEESLDTFFDISVQNVWTMVEF